jgi:predicted peroxiredoxin
MPLINRISFGLLALIAMIVLPMQALGQTAGPQSRDTSYVFVLGSSDMPMAGAALHLAISALQTKRDVHIVLLANGLDLGREGATGPAFEAYGATGPEMLKRAMDAGAAVAVCQICLRNQHLGLEAMADGVVQINAFELLDLMDATDVVLSFGTAGSGDQISIEPMPASGGTAAPQAADECDPATDVDACM